MILSCIRRIQDALGYSVGAQLVANVLRGSKMKRIRDLKLDQLSTYGLLKAKSGSEVQAMLHHLEGEGYLKTGSEHQTLVLTPLASKVLYHGLPVVMKVEKTTNKTSRQPLAEEQAELFEKLKELRAQLARKAGIPAYVVFSNATLTDMAKKSPKTMSELKRVSGVGELKAAWYGKDFLKCIKDALTDNEE